MFATFDLQTNKLTWDVKDCLDGEKYNLCAKELKSCPVPAPASAPTEGMIYQVIRMSNISTPYNEKQHWHNFIILKPCFIQKQLQRRVEQLQELVLVIMIVLKGPVALELQVSRSTHSLIVSSLKKC